MGRGIAAAERGNKAVKKIAVCGKGGSGKSTLVALLAREFCERGRHVLVIDSDESNTGLYRMLGFDHPPAPLLELAGGKKKVQQMMRVRFSAGDEEPNMSVLQRDRIRIVDIPERHLVRRDRMMLVAVGKIHQALEGCACPMGVLTREFLERLELGKDEIALVDMEAGVEHFGRGVETSLDTVLAVVEPSLESVLLASRINQLTTSSGARFAGVVMNKVSDDSMRQRLASELARRDLPLVGVVGHHPEISAASLTGDLPRRGAWNKEIIAALDAVTSKPC